MTKLSSVIEAAKKRIMAKDPSQRSIWFLTYNNEVYNGEIFLEIIRPFTEVIKNKVKNLISWDKILQNLFSWDELDIWEVFIKKNTDTSKLVFSSENERKMLAFSNMNERKLIAYTNLNEIKQDPNWNKFMKAFSKVNDYYKQSNTNHYHKSYYIGNANISPEEKLICRDISDKIIDNVLSIKKDYHPENSWKWITLYELSLTDMLFQLYENNFNL